ncbi:aldo/keto reductase [Maricaulis parjimensis]|uniref:aldo/keto reductase n=1 Tax=Maricaulis parjimensis TaxID=144023 RepID=UPI00193A4290|nr:aldo/keto reductase [Maricaulis parjimensis]
MIDDAAFSRLGFGVTGPHAGLGLSRSATQSLIRQAVDLGVTLFDTGPAYGNGEAEKRLGQALRSVPRHQVFITTKAGVHAGRKRDFSPGAVEMSFKDSLDRLGSGHIDLLLLHGPSPDELDARLIRRLEAFKERGMLRHIGVCGRGPELDTAIDLGAFDAIMAPVNAGLDTASRDRLQRARQAGMSVIGIEVMAGAAPKSALPASRGDLWYAARRVKQVLTGHAPAGSGQDASEALDWALKSELADALVFLTTRQRNLEANARAAGLAERT